MAHDFKEIIKDKNLTIGSELTLKKLKNDKLKKIFLAKNCSISVAEDIKKYASLKKIEVIELDMKNDELGMACKKPYKVSVLSV
ncbi:ribosomal L7Ae/L30e/S12e/Gadd45 family protein [Candidatus Woesearchaeota archaeon]|nr:ribosomal L7Ae/L30e/S12e/Gadd45 family protein [Candidatus Woesearchaeota archaeon]